MCTSKAASTRDRTTGAVAAMPRRSSSWRTLRPVIHSEKCTGCQICWKFCPDDAIEFDAAGFPVIRTDYCKGCGICAAECPPRAIEMRAEA